jgi:hypothetical protein
MNIGLYDGTTQDRTHGKSWTGLQKTNSSPLWIKIKRLVGLSPIPGSFRNKIKEDMIWTGIALATLAADIQLAALLVRLKISDFMRRTSARLHALAQWVKTHVFDKR